MHVRLAISSLAALLVANAGCQRFRLLDVQVNAPEGISINGVSDVVIATQPPIYTYTSPRLALHDGFGGVVGVYLPLEVKTFKVTVSLFSTDCRSFTGSADFEVGAASLTLELGPPKPDGACDAGQGDGDLSPPDHVFVADADDALGDNGDAEMPDAGVDAPPDAADASSDASVCFDPAAGTGAPIPLTAEVLNPDCNQYCDDVASTCPGVFPDAMSCRVLCTRAGWQQQAAGSNNSILTCLDMYPTMVRPDCESANPSHSRVCFPQCEVYCTLRETLCDQDPQTHAGCVSSCGGFRQDQLECRLEVLVQDVPADKRFCSWTERIAGCGRCLP